MSSTSGIAATCPLNVTFYACDFGERFLGCCANGSPADTCTAGCPQEDLLPASFEKEYYAYTTSAACTQGNWWSCEDTLPPFLGCCLSNPCLSGCPATDLRAAIFSPNQTDNPLYSANLDTSTAASSTTSSSTSNAASSTSLHAPGAVHSTITSPSLIHKNPTKEIVGAVTGGIVAVGFIFIVMLLLYRRLRSQRKTDSHSTRRVESGSIKGTLTEKSYCGNYLSK